MIKVKVFMSSGKATDMEKEINGWLSSRKIKVETIKQSSAGDGVSPYTIISVWFDDLENVTEI